MIYKHKDYEWYRIDNLADYLLFSENMDNLTNSEIRSILSIILQRDDKQLSHNIAKTAGGGLLKLQPYISNEITLQDILVNFDNLMRESKQNQLDVLKSGHTLYINSVGGWFSEKDIINDNDGWWSKQEDWIKCENFSSSLVEKFLQRGKSNLLIVENSTILDDDFYYIIYKAKREKDYGLNLSNSNIIYAFDTISEHPKTKEFIASLIKEYGKLNLIIVTTKLKNEYILKIKEYAPYIDTLYINQYKKAKESLSNLDIKIKEL